jgi:hypothetical protein
LIPGEHVTTYGTNPFFHDSLSIIKQNINGPGP